MPIPTLKRIEAAMAGIYGLGRWPTLGTFDVAVPLSWEKLQKSQKLFRRTGSQTMDRCLAPCSTPAKMSRRNCSTLSPCPGLASRLM